MPDDKRLFGDYLREQISQAKITQSAYYIAVGITKPYFYDILSGKVNPPPLEIQKRMIDELEKETGADENRRNAFLNMAAKGRQEIPADIAELIYSNPDAWDTVRKNLKHLLAAQR